MRNIAFYFSLLTFVFKIQCVVVESIKEEAISHDIQDETSLRVTKRRSASFRELIKRDGYDSSWTNPSCEKVKNGKMQCPQKLTTCENVRLQKEFSIEQPEGNICWFCFGPGCTCDKPKDNECPKWLKDIKDCKPC